MSPASPANPSSLVDDAKRHAPVRRQRRPEGVRRPGCGSAAVVRHGRGDARRRRQRHRREACAARSDDLTGTAPAGHRRPPRVRALRPCLTGLNLPDRQIARGPDLGGADVRAVAERLRRGPAAGLPPARPEGGVETDEVHVAAGHGGDPAAVAEGGVPAGAGGPGALPAAARPPRTGRPSRARRGAGGVVVRTPADVRQRTVRPAIGGSVAKGALVHAGECGVYARPDGWGCGRKAVRRARGGYARDDDGDGSREAHVDTPEGFRSPLRSRPRPRRGVSREKPPPHPASFRVVRDARRRGKALLATLAGAPVTPTLPQHPGSREGPAFIGAGKADLRPAWLSAAHIGAFP